MMTDSQMHDAGMTMAATSIATMIRTNSPQAMAPAEKSGKFTGMDFKRCQQKMFFYLTTLCLQRNYILSCLQDDLYNTYSKTKTVKKLWGALEQKFKMEDVGTKKFFVARFLEYKMIDNKSGVSQVQELQVIIYDLPAKGELTIFTEYIIHHTEIDFVNVEVGTDCEHSAGSCVDFDTSEGEKYDYEGLEAIGKEGGRVVSDRFENYKELYVGSFIDEYNKLEAYAQEIRRSNPESDIVINISKDALAKEKRQFLRMYLCFDALDKDDVGGLYIQEPKGDSWIHVPQVKEVLMINIEDVLQIMSNDRHKNVEHRAIEFMIPGTIFMSLLVGSLCGIFKGIALVVFTTTTGASSCYFLSKMIRKPLVFSLWPDKLTFFQAQIEAIEGYLVGVLCIVRLWNLSFAKWLRDVVIPLLVDLMHLLDVVLDRILPVEVVELGLIQLGLKLGCKLGRTPAPQATSQTQAQVLLNVATCQEPLPVDISIAVVGKPKDLKNFMDLKPPEFDVTPSSVEPQKFLDRCEKILTTLVLKETRGVEFTIFLFLGSPEAWWTSILRGRQAGLPLITWSQFSAMFLDRFIPLSKQDDMRLQFNEL
ncbi:hypothetical protein CQW23_07085 [Capsicum baccatum]|uniref:Isopenicillin N synthase-like Fe(2+) 2OG dioxygenase domain-containing protein n=1 Tax=Capsicum baccatum TaxID=33114 RepID=A0A2G2X586_CAPBA|nr:hypothetical protein CQW23_07085 [Capsicum baccatum]